MNYEIFCKNFGNNLKYYRRIKNLTQEELAEQLDIADYHYISKIENGKCNITFKTIYKISNALNIEIHKLFMFNSI